MPVCKFFLEGRCKYGDRCHFEHPQRGQNQGVQRQLFGGGGGNQRGAYRDSFATSQGNPISGNQYKWTSTGNPRQQQQASGQSSVDLVNNLPKEIENCEKSKQWPFSCVCIEKDLPCLPDFVDWSPEELRLEAYTAMKSGDIQSYVTKMQQLSVDYSNKRQQLKNLSPSLKQKLIEFMDDYKNKKGPDNMRQSTFGGGGSSSSGFATGTSTSAFSAQSPISTFGQSTFGGGSTPSATSAFGSGSSAAFGAGTNSIFGSKATFGGMSSVGSSSSSAGGAGGTTFGSSSAAGSGSVFGSASQGTFGSVGSTGFAPATQPTGFGSAPATQPTGFGSAPATQPTGFGSSPTTQSTGFGSATGSVFGGSAFTPSTGPSAFGAAPATSAFGNSTSTGSSNTAAPPSGFFSGGPAAASVTASAMPPATAANSRTYTPLTELTEEEKAQFSAPSFVLGRIPTKPPPRELING